MGLLSQPEGLLHSFEVQPGNKASGIDKVRKTGYADGVQARIAGVQWQRFSKVLSDWMPSLRIQHNLYPKPLWMTQAGSRMV